MRSRQRHGTAALAARRQRRRDADRGELLAAAERIFSTRGYAGASIREIAAGAGFSVGGVYQLFRGKDELLAAVLDTVFREYLTVTRTALGQPTFPRRLAAYTRASGEFVAARRAFLAIIVAERTAIVGALGGAVGRQLARHRQARRRQVVRLMTSGVAEGVLRFGDAEFLASAYLGLITQCQMDALAGPRTLPSADDVVSLFCSGAARQRRPARRTSA